MLDLCNASPAESKVSLAISAVGCLLGIVGNTFLFENVIMHEGFRATMDDQGREVWTGQWTRSGVRISCLSSVLFLLLGSLFTAFVYDADHSRLYFVQRSRRKHQ